MVHNVIQDIRLLGFTVGERSQKHGDFYTVIAWCFECNAWHSHSGFRTEPEPGIQLHRYPHCWSDSYAKQNLYDGYVIEIVGRATLEVMEDYQRSKPRGLKLAGWRKGENPIALQTV